MGTKQQIATEVAGLVSELRPTMPVLDAFCGMCSVAGAVAPSGRAVWGNDVQRYAVHVATCLLATVTGPPHATGTTTLLRSTADRNADKLRSRFASAVAAEQTVLDEPTVDAYQAAYGRWRHAANDAALAAEVAELRSHRRRVPYRLATLTFAWGYFGLAQAIAIDSLRYAIERHRSAGDLSDDDRRWALLALLQAASRLATGPGHTAQYLAANTSRSLDRVIRQRRRDLHRQFEIELGLLSPYGTSDWRAGNQVLHRDATEIWPELRRRGFRDAVVYADPPYSKNQYSRFYHVLETLHRYDYPAAQHGGRYRPDRFSTGFSSRARVASAFERLCAGAASINCALVLSYPSNGLLIRYGKGQVAAVLSRHFGSVQLAMRRPIVQSTLGAGHGARNTHVDELVFVCKP
jgi:adenine-specific DNA-methyltransferase